MDPLVTKFEVIEEKFAAIQTGFVDLTQKVENNHREMKDSMGTGKGTLKQQIVSDVQKF